MSSAQPICPPGFDCALLNSCPSYTQPCPEGYFCGSYEGMHHQSLMDYRYAQLVNLYQDDADVTHDNKKKYIDADRTIQSSCLAGFYCPDSATMEVSPATLPSEC